MPDPIDRKAFVDLCEMSMDNMYELAALGELLEQKGLITKQEIMTLATELKHQNPPADPSDPHTQRFTVQKNSVVDQPMEVIEQHRLSAAQDKILLGRTIQLLDWGKQAANEMPEANA